MADFRQVHLENKNPVLRFHVEHYESRLKASNFDDSLELLAALASIISLEGPKLEPPKLGYFTTFRAWTPKKTCHASKRKSLKYQCDDHSKQSRTLSRVSTLKGTQPLSSTRTKSRDVKILHGSGQQGLSCEHQYKKPLVKTWSLSNKTKSQKVQVSYLVQNKRKRTTSVASRLNTSCT